MSSIYQYITSIVDDENSGDAKKRKLLAQSNLDSDVDKSSSESSDNSDSESDSDSGSDNSEDETAELLRELAKIKKERAEEKERLEKEAEAEAQKRKEEAMASGNPLIALTAKTKDFSVKKSWTEETVFKNQAKGVNENPRKRFVNDLLRSDFHRKFMTVNS